MWVAEGGRGGERGTEGEGEGEGEARQVAERRGPGGAERALTRL